MIGIRPQNVFVTKFPRVSTDLSCLDLTGDKTYYRCNWEVRCKTGYSIMQGVEVINKILEQCN